MIDNEIWWSNWANSTLYFGKLSIAGVFQHWSQLNAVFSDQSYIANRDIQKYGSNKIALMSNVNSGY